METPAMTLYDFALISLATLYLSEVITGKSGPFSVFTAIRARAGGLLSCVWCIAPWIWGVMALVYFLLSPPIVWVFAGAGVAMAIRSYTGVHHGG